MAQQEKEKTPSFAIYLMFSEGVQFSTPEIQAALLEDFPGLDISPNGGLDIPMACDTDTIIPMAPILMGSTGEDATFVNMMRLPGYGTWDPNALTPRQLIACGDYDMKSALTRNRSYLCISVSAKTNSLTDRFRAARLVSCVAALFAELPICLGAYWEPGDHFLSPQGICDMAKEAMSDDWPVQKWIGLGLAGLGSDKQGQEWSNGATVGLRHFTDYEVQLTAAPQDVGSTANTLYAIAWLPLVSGNTFNDGDTTGGENGHEKYRLRWATQGMTAKSQKSPPVPYDCFIAIHPESPFDEKAFFGKVPHGGGRNPKVSYAPREGFFKRIMGRGQA